jgi:hypothetical protein
LNRITKEIPIFFFGGGGAMTEWSCHKVFFLFYKKTKNKIKTYTALFSAMFRFVWQKEICVEMYSSDEYGEG